MKWKLAGVLVCAFSLLGCGSDVQRSDDGPAKGDELDAPITTTVPLDVGAFHNEILTRVRARAALPMSISPEEFVAQLRRAANKAIEPYGPSRLFTDEDCQMVLQVWSEFVAPYFDVTFQDPARADPMAVVEHLREVGMIDDAELQQMEVLLGGGDVYSIGPSGPASEGIAIAKEIHDASLMYWSGGRPQDDGVPDKTAIRNQLADVLGGLIGWALALGNPAGILLTGGMSLVFICDGLGAGGASGGGGGSGGSDPCHPRVGPPCD